MKPGLFFQNRQQQGDPIRINPQGGPPRDSIIGRADQGLQFHQNGTGPFETGNDHGAGNMEGTFREEQGRGVLNFRQAGVFHFKDPDFVGRTETVFNRPEYSVGMAPFAFKIQDRIHHMLQNAGAGDNSLLGDVSDQKKGSAGFFGPDHQPAGHLPDLGYASRRRTQFSGKNGLDRVNGQKPGLEALEDFQNRIQGGFRQDLDRAVSEAQAFPAHFDLTG